MIKVALGLQLETWNLELVIRNSPQVCKQTSPLSKRREGKSEPRERGVSQQYHDNKDNHDN